MLYKVLAICRLFYLSIGVFGWAQTFPVFESERYEFQTICIRLNMRPAGTKKNHECTTVHMASEKSVRLIFWVGSNVDRVHTKIEYQMTW